MKRFIMISTIILGSTFVEGSDLVEALDATTPTSPATPPLETSPTIPQKLKRLEEIRKPNPSTDIARPVTSPDDRMPVKADDVTFVNFTPLKKSPRVPSPLALPPKTHSEE